MKNKHDLEIEIFKKCQQLKTCPQTDIVQWIEIERLANRSFFFDKGMLYYKLVFEYSVVVFSVGFGLNIGDYKYNVILQMDRNCQSDMYQI